MENNSNNRFDIFLSNSNDIEIHPNYIDLPDGKDKLNDEEACVLLKNTIKFIGSDSKRKMLLDYMMPKDGNLTTMKIGNASSGYTLNMLAYIPYYKKIMVRMQTKHKKIDMEKFVTESKFREFTNSLKEEYDEDAYNALTNADNVIIIDLKKL